jgi:hypothetical protein
MWMLERVFNFLTKNKSPLLFNKDRLSMKIKEIMNSINNFQIL